MESLTTCNGLCAAQTARLSNAGAEIPAGMRENAIGTQVLKAAINVHRELGPGLLELKSVERISPAHKKQVQTYLRLTGLKLGYLLNFGEAILKSGIWFDPSRALRLCPACRQPVSHASRRLGSRCVNGLEE